MVKDDFKINYSEQNEIDLNKLFFIVLSNKKLICFLSIIGFLIGCIISLIPRRTFEGEFQIVLDKGNDPISSLKESTNSTLSRLGGLAGLDKLKSTNLSTQVEVLKSPSVLMDIFEFVKKEKISKNKSFKDYKFKNWRDQFNIGLERGTSVLSLSYRDKDKELILPVLDQISKTYQDYTNESRKRNLSLAKKYFKDQITFYKEQSKISMQEFMVFGLDNNMSLDLGSANNAMSGISRTPNITVTSIGNKDRVIALNKIAYLKDQLKTLNKIDDYSDEILFISSMMPNSETASTTSKKIIQIEKILAKYRLIYEEKDDTIQDALSNKRVLLKLLKNQFIGALNAEIEQEKIRLKSIQRPKETMIIYDNLKRKAYKDITTIDNLENQYRSLLLDEASDQKPWYLITKPTLLPYPVAPERKKISILGLLIGSITGVLSGFYLDKKDDKIKRIEDLEKIINVPVLEEFSLNNESVFNDKFSFLNKNTLKDLEGKISFLEIGNFENLKKVNNYIKLTNLIKQKKIIISRKLSEAIDYHNIILVIALGISQNSEIINLRKKLLNKYALIKGSIILKIEN